MEILILAVALIGALVGFCQGALKQIANMAGIVVGLVIAVMLYDRFGQMLADLTGAEESIADIIAFVAIAVLLPLVLGWVATLLTKLFKVVHLNFFNRLLGAVIGFISYMLLLSVAFNLFDFVKSGAGLRTEKLQERPALYYDVKQAAQFIVPDFIIVTDSTEEAHGAQPRHSIQDKIEKFGL